MDFVSSHGGTDPKAGLDYLESLAHIKGQGGLGIVKLRAVMAQLANPQDRIPTAHVAGTNGKGSVSVALASILGAMGKRTLLNTSPHLVRVNERIVCCGLPVEDGELNLALEQIKVCSERLGVSLSHFEAITGAAFIISKARAVDWGVFEVGLGGRLDATNIIEAPKVSAIVSIDFDHEALLGDTLSKIAVEKAGIVKPKVPVVIGKMADDALREIKRVGNDAGAPQLVFGEDFWVENQGRGTYKFRSPSLGDFSFSPALLGDHQVVNMAVAAAMGRVIGASADDIAEGIAAARWPGRLSSHQIGERELIFDSAHNVAGIKSLISFLDSKGLTGIEIIFGVLGSKRWKEMVDILVPYVSEWNLLEPDHMDAVAEEELANYLSGFGIKVRRHGRNYLNILDDAAGGCGRTPLVVTGSMYMIGKLMGVHNLPIPRLWTRRVAANE